MLGTLYWCFCITESQTRSEECLHTAMRVIVNFHLNITALVGIWSECCDCKWTRYWSYWEAIGISGTTKNNMRKQMLYFRFLKHYCLQYLMQKLATCHNVSMETK